MTEVKNNPTLMETKDQVKGLMVKLKGEENPEELEKARREFKDLIAKANPLVIALAENELVKEGFSQQDLMSACDVHLMLFKDAIENPNLKLPPEHPISKFQEEHRGILKIMEDLRHKIKRLRAKGSLDAGKDEIRKISGIAAKLMEAENHNVRQENTLFPILENHGIEQPPAIMWAEHTEMKEQKKEIVTLLKDAETMDFNEFCTKLHNLSTHLLEKFSLHTQKEEHILYMSALEVITDQEWKDIKEECDNLGYFNLNL